MNSFCDNVQLAWQVVHATAQAVLSIKRPSQGTEKDEVNVGHHAIVIEGDTFSQTLGLQILAHAGGKFLTEEKQDKGVVAESRLITQEGFASVMEEELVWIFDPLDGSSFKNRQLPEWSVSLGVVSMGNHIGGAIFTPEIFGGFGVLGERTKGVMIYEQGNFRSASNMLSQQRKKSVVFMGLDTYFVSGFSHFVREMAVAIQTTSSTSCALGLAYLVAGKIDALVQPVQAPWDWAAGYPLVEEVGGKFQFFHYRDGSITALARPDVKSYDPVWRNTAFIAGEPDIVDWLFDLLQQNWRRPQ
ncbi:MAG: hypothetical protein A3D44_03000 [Candidatus Staskawiczbacteria bacterium RIFCSPHIGHO2_02_FULL_42_22]|uniref:Inositol monophosphatase n=1 Tax=Candidatus Staskawiczbacteria bacterium RIFCSPHIGHO2_02_FULL_42_22 TaxID=1802207 RepID=A0A1G2I5R5_9BACT|nr:MAG: hypothetical protein A3D44_03000 [Candidatus Staskawiczbacteria bacterium RIFCSPHIGHO2_02_FULL_42_22]